MDVFTAMKERRSCRNYLPEPISEGIVQKILEAATWAPSPLNSQPWEFIVVTQKEMKEKIFSEAERCRRWAREKSGWKWLDRYGVDFLRTVPVMIAVIGDPKGTGVDMFFKEGATGYQHACAAAIQNMHLAAQSLSLGSLWFTLFDKDVMREILGVDTARTPVGLVCIGMAADKPVPAPRKAVSEKTTYIR
jgi:5,6-dimethylbenzimidazole synthase